MCNTNYENFAKELEDLADVVRGFDKDGYEMGWAFVKGALHAMGKTVDSKIEEVREPKELEVFINEYEITDVAKDIREFISVE